MSQTIKQQYIEEQQHTEGQQRPYERNDDHQRSTQLLWSRINIISIGHTIYLQ